MAALETIATIPNCEAAMDERDDLSLLGAIAQQRDRAAFSELCERYRQRAYNVALRILRNPTMAEDAVQEAMLSIWLSNESMPPNNAQAWILGIITKKSLKLGSRQRRSEKRVERMMTNPVRTEHAAATEVEGHELIDLLRKQIDQLPELESKLLACSYVAGMPHQKIAELVGMPRRTVTDRINQALERLRLNLTNAGVAAVVPLISAENLFEALTTGNACPPGATEGLLSQIESVRTKAARPRSHRRIKVQSGGSMVVPAIGIAVVAAAAIWFALGGNAPVKKPAVSQPRTPAPEIAPPAPAPTPAVAEKPPVKVERFDRQWTFETGAPDDISVRNGAWKWQGRGNMVCEGDTFLFLPQVPADRAMLLEVRARRSDPTNVLGADWTDGNSTLSGRAFANPNGLNPNTIDTWRDLKVYFVGTRVFNFINDTGYVIKDYRDKSALKNIFIHSANNDIAAIRLREVDEKELPSLVKSSLDTLITDHGWRAKESTGKALPENASH